MSLQLRAPQALAETWMFSLSFESPGEKNNPAVDSLTHWKTNNNSQRKLETRSRRSPPLAVYIDNRFLTWRELEPTPAKCLFAWLVENKGDPNKAKKYKGELIQ